MKKELLVLTMAIGMAAALMASGNQEDETEFRGRGPGMSREFDRSDERQAEMEAWLAEQEILTITGSLTLINGEQPFIESDGIKFSIMAPWSYLEELELTDGMEVSVEGYEMPGPRFQWDDSEKSIMVTKALIDGEEIEIEHPADGMGRRGGPQGGMGRGGKGGFAGAMMGRRS